MLCLGDGIVGCFLPKSLCTCAFYLSTLIHVYVEIKALQKTTEMKWPKLPKVLVLSETKAASTLSYRETGPWSL